jgi:hypothetical protein
MPRKGIEACGRLTHKGMVVFSGSQAVFSERPSAQSVVRKVRQKLKNEGSLIEEAGRYRFTRDTEFPSATQAAYAVTGGSAEGLRAWKDTAGKTLKDKMKIDLAIVEK